MIKISVVIGTFNQKDVLKQTLESLFNQTLGPEQYEIIVVDSFSNDGTDAMIESLQSPAPFTFIRQENKGKTSGRNRGIKESRGEIILLTDADMVADANLLSEHLNAHQKKEKACFEGLTYNINFEFRISNFEFNPNCQIPNEQTKPYIKEKLRPGQKLKWASFLSGNLSAKKETLLKAGLFDEDFKGYGWEDIELGYRLHKMGIPLYYLPSAVNYHYHFTADSKMRERKYNMGKSAAIFYRKHPNFEIKMFLGMNPLAMGIYHFLKKHPKILEKITSKYLLEEYSYRQGLEEGLKNSPA